MSTKQEMEKMYPYTQNLPGAETLQPTAPPPGVMGYTPMIANTNVGPIPNAGPVPNVGAPQPVYYMQAAPTVLQLGPREMITFCPSCQSRNMTRIVHESNSRTHLIAGILCLLTCCCCCIPYCMDSCKSSLHYCTQCNAYLGSYSN